MPQRGPLWIAGGIVVALLIAWAERTGALESGREAYFVAAGIALYGVAQLVSGQLSQGTQYPLKLGAAALMTIPVAIVFFVFQKRIMNVSAGAVKE